MFRLLIDTSVWLDLTKDGQQRPLLQALEDLVATREVELLVPDTVRAEFDRNKQRVLADTRKSVTSSVKRARSIIESVGSTRGRTSALRLLDEIEQKTPTLDELAGQSVRRIERLFSQADRLPITDNITLRAAKRALTKAAPFHRDRNSIDDAVIFEHYADAISAARKKGVRFAFVTHNTKDFSDPHGDKRLPHPDLAGAFSKVRSLYFITVKEALQRMAPELLQNAVWEHDWTAEPRSMSEIGQAIDNLVSTIWYDRHSMRADMIANGKIKLVSRDEWAKATNKSGIIVDEIWRGALAAAKKVERQLGQENLGPWSQFEWGMLNGKLSALRWALGDEWDMLDT